MPDLYTGCAQPFLSLPCEVTRRRLLALSRCGIPSIYTEYIEGRRGE